MHASIWRFAGDPEDLLRRYERMIGELPAGNMRLHLCLVSEDGIVLVDTCPTREVYEAFAASPEFRAVCDRHGLPEPERVEDFPVHAAFVEGRRT